MKLNAHIACVIYDFGRFCRIGTNFELNENVSQVSQLGSKKEATVVNKLIIVKCFDFFDQVINKYGEIPFGHILLLRIINLSHF